VGRIKKTDRNAAEQASAGRADALRGELIAFARVQMFSFFDEDSRAAEILKPIVRGEAAQVQEPRA
jgi:hypothetical protein